MHRGTQKNEPFSLDTSLNIYFSQFLGDFICVVISVWGKNEAEQFFFSPN